MKALINLAAIGFALLSSTSAFSNTANDYTIHCSACHGRTLQGAIGPSLLDTKWAGNKKAFESIQKIIADGVPNTSMAAWKPRLSEEKISSLASFILKRNESLKKTSERLTPPLIQSSYSELKEIDLLKGFEISVFADGVETDRALAVAPSGTEGGRSQGPAPF